ncbi:DoxX family protein [Nocardia sp. NBC_01327]|uniref:DoxX family protein n=1 Tax=Nocardia sp. NBC_01327 TaxID=2903593 RepID=UPI002E12C657|nr:DoxX family protein [Nocardia sp. NBC_01327]
MNVTLWIVAGVLAAASLFGGISKTFIPKEKLAAAPGGGWTATATVPFVKSLGILELLAALGLILPAALDIAPIMVPITATCWILLMVGAAITHLRHNEPKFIAVNLVYLALAVVIAWGRFGPYAF